MRQGNYNLGLLKQNKKFIFQQKKSPRLKSMLFEKFQAFDNRTLPDSALMQGGEGENFEFEKLRIFWNLRDF